MVLLKAGSQITSKRNALVATIFLPFQEDDITAEHGTLRYLKKKNSSIELTVVAVA